MTTYTKIDDTILEVVTPQPDKVEILNLDMLVIERQNFINEIAELNKQIENLNQMIIEIDNKMIKAKDVGVMTTAEIGMIAEEVIPIKEPLQEEDVIVK